MSNNNEVTNVDLTLRLGVPSQENSERVVDHAANEQVNHAPAPPPPPPRRRQNADDGKVCIACGTTDTPLWRKGPNGPQTLCNACGLKYARTVRRGAQ